MTDLHVLRVFLGPDGSGGNPLGVFVDGGSIPAGRRQAVAADLGFSETVFVDGIDPAGGVAVVRIFTPAAELPFAGHRPSGHRGSSTGSATASARSDARQATS